MRRRFPWASFVIVLMMVPREAHGELEISASGWTFAGDNRVTMDVPMTNGYGSARASKEGRSLPGFGFGLIYWFPGAPFFGVGIEGLSSKVECDYSYTDFWDIHCCALIRIQSGRNSDFPHGRVIPYLGIGYVGFQCLSGDIYLLSPDGYHDQSLEVWSSQLVLKAGLEWMILGWAAFFVEGRIMSGELSGSEMEGSSLSEESASIPGAEFAIGIAVHVFK